MLVALKKILSVLYFVYFFITAALLFFVLALMYPLALVLDRTNKLSHYLTLLWGHHFVRLNPFWKCSFEGSENLKAGQKYVIVANHQSVADVFLLAGLRHQFRWVAKESLMRVPFFGWIMRLNGDVAIKRGDKKSIIEMMSQCKDWLNKNVSIMIFPEGTRSEDGTILQFRDGPFRLAMDCDVHILPVVINGTCDIISKTSKSFNFSGEMRVNVLQPVAPAEFGGDSRNMRHFVQELMTSKLTEMRASGAH